MRLGILSIIGLCRKYLHISYACSYQQYNQDCQQDKQSAFFNFIIFASIIIYLYQKIKVTDKIDKAKEGVVTSIEDSKTAKAESEDALKKIEESLSHIEEEIDGIIKKSEENAKLVGGKILEDAEKTISGIKENTEKTVENKKTGLRNDLIRRASLASIEVAKNHIVNELNNNYDLHQRLIDESIEAIEGVELK